MLKFLAPAVLALGLAACAGPDDDADRERQIKIWVNFIQSEVELLVDIYGNDWFKDLDNEERFFILSGCNALTALAIGNDEWPAEVPETIIEICQLIRHPSNDV